MIDITTYITEMASMYRSRSGRSALDKEQFEGTIYDVMPPEIEFTKAKKLLAPDGKSVNTKAYEKFLKLSNTQLKVCNRSYALLQHIKNNGGDIWEAIKDMKSVWTGYFEWEDIFDMDDTKEISKEMEKVLD